MHKVANSPALPHRQAQLMNHPATKHKTTLKHLSVQKANLKMKKYIYKLKEILHGKV